MDEVFKSVSRHLDEFVDRHPGVLGIATATAAQTLVDLTEGVYGILAGHGSEVADKFDKKVDQTSAALRSWGDSLVEAYPDSKLAIVGATALASIPATAMEFAKGTVDTARVGTGVAEGTWSGVAKDGIRTLSILAPAYKASRFVYGTIATAFVKDAAPFLGACTEVSITKALAHSGQSKAYASLDKLLKQVIQHPIGAASIDEGRNLHEMAGDLGRLGARFKLGNGPSTMKHLEDLTRSNPNGVTVFTAHWKQFNPRLWKNEEVGHAMYAFVDDFGRFRIADRSGKVVRSLGQLEAAFPYGYGYTGLSKAALGRMVMHIPMSRFLTTMERGGALGMALSAVRMTAAGEFRDRVRDFLKFKSSRPVGRPSAR
jgi:hypothetical protein